MKMTINTAKEVARMRTFPSDFNLPGGQNERKAQCEVFIFAIAPQRFGAIQNRILGK